MENRKATLSPVKLWSGNIEITSTKQINIPNLNKYNVILCNVTLYGEFPAVCIQGKETRLSDDIGDGHGVHIGIFVSGDNITINVIEASYTYPKLLEVWGIG